MNDRQRLFSIIVPVYFNEPNLAETIPALLDLEEGLRGYGIELIFVDDGSGDRSLEVLLEFQNRFAGKIRVVKLTRNFGSMAAIQAGLSIAAGDCVGMISADLQDPPELFIDMIGHWERGMKAVFAVRADREESALQKRLSNLYYRLMRRIAIPGYPEGGFDFFLIDRQIVDEVNRISEKNTNLMSLIFWLGHSHVLIPYVRRKRTQGVSRWTLSKKIKLFVDSFVAFSYAPIRFASLLGFTVALSAFIYGGIVLYSWFVQRIDVKGYTPIMIMLVLTAGIQMIILGMLGEYLWRTLDETRRRPTYVIDKIYGSKEES